MDVRCEKCQTEYELDEARLKPGGVTVKCTNCGHMFKIRKRTPTNVGMAATLAAPTSGPPTLRDPVRPRTSSAKPPPVTGRAAGAVAGGRARGESLLDDEMRPLGPDEAPTTVERQWLIRLETGEQKSCRELATLQQWIIAGVVTRESLISRTGKTWKRIGDIADLDQYFVIADEARASRDRTRPQSRPGGPIAGPIASVNQIPGTFPGYGAAQAAGGTILPDDDDSDARTVRAPPRQLAHTPPPVPVRGQRSGPIPGSAALGPTEPVALPMHARPVPAAPPRRPGQTPPPPPPRRVGAASGPAPSSIPPPDHGNRATAMWATDGVAPEVAGAAQSGPFVGKLSAIPDEPAFAGRVRMAPGDAASFDPSRVRIVDDDDGVLPARRSSRAGMWVLIMALVVMGGAAAAVYLFVLRDGHDDAAAHAGKDAGTAVAVVAPDAAQVAVTPPADAAAEVAPALASARGELAADLEPRLRAAAQALDGKLDAPAQALRAHVIAQLAQDELDRASLMTGAGADADALRKESKQLVLDAATAAQRALRAAGDDPGANIAMAEVLRLQGKPAKDIARYLDTARARPDKDWAVELALADAMVLARDGKLDDARAAFATIDGGGGKLETAGDVRARFHLALALAGLGKPADAKPLVDAILAAQPEHAGAKALAGKLETMVARTDPLPPEDGAKETPPPTPATPTPPTPATRTPVAHTPPPRPAPGTPPAPPPPTGGPDTYERLVARANAVADTSCPKAMELYSKALEQKPNGVEALAGLGYCQIDAKQFSSAFSKFRAALAVSPRYEPALRGIAETYQQQGRKEQAIEAYKAYLDVYPDSVAAKKQLERLGGETGSHPPAGSAAPPAPPPPAPANPPATPPPAPSGDSSGAGSGSG